MKNTISTKESSSNDSKSSDRSAANGSQFVVKWMGPPLDERTMIVTLDEIRTVWKDHVASRDCFDGSKESLVVLAINNQHHLMGWHVVSIGDSDGVCCGPRDVLRAALALDAYGIVLIHNHPSGSLIVSRPDELATRGLASACKTVGVVFHDHVIVDSEGSTAVSMRATNPVCFVDVTPAHPLRRPESLSRSPDEQAAEDMITASLLEVPPQCMFIPMPRVFFWKTSLRKILPKFAETIRGVPKNLWVEKWNDGRQMKKRYKQVKSYKFLPLERVLVADDDLKTLKAAATEIGITPEDMIAALLWDLMENAGLENLKARLQNLKNPKIVSFPG